MDKYIELLSEKQREAHAYYKANEDSWLSNPLYVDKHVLIYENQLVGIYDHFDTAYIAAEGKYRQGDYIIQRLVDPNKVVSFYSPAIAL